MWVVTINCELTWPSLILHAHVTTLLLVANILQYFSAEITMKNNNIEFNARFNGNY